MTPPRGAPGSDRQTDAEINAHNRRATTCVHTHAHTLMCVHIHTHTDHVLKEPEEQLLSVGPQICREIQIAWATRKGCVNRSAAHLQRSPGGRCMGGGWVCWAWPAPLWTQRACCPKSPGQQQLRELFFSTLWGEGGPIGRRV